MRKFGLLNKIKLWPFLLALVMMFSAAAFAQALTWPNSLTRIEEEAFYNDVNLTGPLNLPASITYIGPRAFGRCTNLTGPLVLPEGLTYIGSQAFAYCTSLTGEVVIPESVTDLADDAFEGTPVTLVFAGEDDGNDDVTTDTDLPITTDTDIPGDGGDDDGGVSTDTDLPVTTDTDLPGDGDDDGDDSVITMTDLPEGMSYEMTEQGAVITAFNPDFEGALTLPATINGVPVVGIGDSAFRDCSGLTGSVIIPSTVTSIGNYAFYGCGGLDGYVYIPASVTAIGNYAFCDCYSLTGGLSLPASIASVGDYAFAYCESLTGSLYMPAGAAVGSRCFQGSGLTGSFTVPASMTLAPNAFAGTKLDLTWAAPAFTYTTTGGTAALTGWNGPMNNLTIPAQINGLNVTAIAADAFSNIGLTGTLNISGSVSFIGATAFAGNDGITGLVLNEGLVTISSHAFAYLTGLTGSVTIPATATQVHEDAFAGTNVTLVPATE